MNKWFLIYFLVSGLLMFSWVYYGVNFSPYKEDMEDDIADVTWETGISRESVQCFLYLMSLLFGWIAIPYEIIVNLFIKRKEEE